MARPPQPEAGAGRRGHAGVSECEGRRGFIPTPACPREMSSASCQNFALPFKPAIFRFICLLGISISGKSHVLI